ncbi:Sbal_3080 family lipoprotein [Variovorax sp. WS11]|nr:Sbal_3080 family lipoprotein [Variovorax sp. WS11]
MRPFILGAAALLTACASTSTVRPVSGAKFETVCIERNADVYVEDLLPAIEDAFRRNGIATRVFDTSPAPCPYRVTYAASRRWDLKPFMSDARISLYHDRELVGEATYALPSGVFGGGGINPDKWRGASFKIDPILDKMLASLKSPG